jgi:hypothetical protein
MKPRAETPTPLADGVNVDHEAAAVYAPVVS